MVMQPQPLKKCQKTVDSAWQCMGAIEVQFKDHNQRNESAGTDMTDCHRQKNGEVEILQPQILFSRYSRRIT